MIKKKRVYIALFLILCLVTGVHSLASAEETSDEGDKLLIQEGQNSESTVYEQDEVTKQTDYSNPAEQSDENELSVQTERQENDSQPNKKPELSIIEIDPGKVYEVDLINVSESEYTCILLKVWQEQDGRVVAALTGQSIDGLVACDLQFRLHLDGRVVGCRFVAVASSKQACGQSDCNQCFCTHHRECYFLSAKIVINHKKSIVQAVFCFFLFNFAALVRAAETLTARNKIEENRSSR